MFLSKNVTNSEKRPERISRTFFAMSEHETPERKVAMLYSDFTEWGSRVEKEVVIIKHTLVWIAILLIPIGIYACQHIKA